MTTRLSDAELINEIINRRGYLTIGSQIPLPLGLTLRSVDLGRTTHLPFYYRVRTD